MLKIQINSIFGELLFEYECEGNTFKKTVEEAIRQNADLRSADLRSADLRSADLRYANLRYADLRYADLRSADLRYANLRSADLRSADLCSADLRSADLSSADLCYADLRSADLSSTKKILDSEWANQCKQNILYILMHLKSEVPFLKERLIAGEVDGTQYEGECACLVGTLGKNTSMDKACKFIPFYSNGIHNLGEQFFLNIRKGDTPENSEFCKVAVELCDMVLNHDNQ